MPRGRVVLTSAEDTIAFGAGFASRLKAGDILALQGELGAGKTTFVQGLLQGLAILDTAQSPTFTYLQIYQGTLPIYHFDLYRIKKEQDFIFLGFEEFLYSDGISVVEWPERIPSIIPKETTLIELSYCDSGRIASIRSWGQNEV
jgi:tRNA threonylcarbamoyladenosine biosynthesis protein TsaE